MPRDGLRDSRLPCCPRPSSTPATRKRRTSQLPPYTPPKKKARPQPAPAVAPAAGPNADSARRAQEDAARRAAEDAARRRAGDSADAAAAHARHAAAAGAHLRATLTTMVHFDYDQSDLRPEDRAILDAKVPILTAN